jgi:hypothetical protein
MQNCPRNHSKQHWIAPKVHVKHNQKHHTETKTKPKTQTKRTQPNTIFHTPILSLSNSKP